MNQSVIEGVRNRFIHIITLLFMPPAVQAAEVELHVTDMSESEPVEFAAVGLSRQDDNVGGTTDVNGLFRADIGDGIWRLRVNSIGFTPFDKSLEVNGDTVVEIKLSRNDLMIGEVVVTAKESGGMSTASMIDRQAMRHLQPSSFSDLLELIPGNISKDPSMGSVNIINLRSAANNVSDDYATSALGTSFVVDGVPLNTSSDMQLSPDVSRSGRSATGKGIDMRSISTDDIESVEIVRGIASAEYGEVTGGLVNIRRKNRSTLLEARFKADQQSRLFYLGKGIKLPAGWNINISADYLDSRIDPRNNRDNFKRITGSLRSDKRWAGENYVSTWNSSLNYTGTFERDKNDPDLTINDTRDYYISDRNMLSWNNTLSVDAVASPFFRNITLISGVSCADEHLHQEKTIASSRLYPMPVSMKPGENYVGFLPMLYDAEFDLHGKPVTAFGKVTARMRYRFGKISNRLNVGAEWNFNKNYGRGQVYDLMRPLTPGNNTRPRAFSDVPALNQLSAYVENVSMIGLREHEVEARIGLRETQLIGLGSRYSLSGKPYFDPRINLKWTFPSVFAAGYPVVISLTGGLGWHTKMPVSAYLFPESRYTDYVQLNYFHDNEAYRAMNVMTFIEDITNYDLSAARNLKHELRLDMSYRGNRASVTFFKEDMKDGFRFTPEVHRYTYRQYDASGYDPSISGRPPQIEDLPFREVTKLVTVSKVTNGSRTLKEGVEFMLSSCRIPVVRTRITVSGAYFRTTLSNSQPLWYKPAVIVNGEELQYVGLYDDVEGSVYRSFNTNFVFDTDIPRLRLNFSIAIQNMWMTSTMTLRRDGVPTYYMDPAGEIHEFTEESASNPYLLHLIRSYSPTAFDERRVPVSTTFNIKATKRLWDDRIGIAVYVNRLLSITPDYYLYGVLNRRYSSPYFGMEMNFKF